MMKVMMLMGTVVVMKHDFVQMMWFHSYELEHQFSMVTHEFVSELTVFHQRELCGFHANFNF